MQNLSAKYKDSWKYDQFAFPYKSFSSQYPDGS